MLTFGGKRFHYFMLDELMFVYGSVLLVLFVLKMTNSKFIRAIFMTQTVIMILLRIASPGYGLIDNYIFYLEIFNLIQFFVILAGFVLCLLPK